MWPAEVVDPMGATFVDNYSEERAALSNGVQRQNVAELFRDTPATRVLPEAALAFVGAAAADAGGGGPRASSAASSAVSSARMHQNL